MLKHKVTQKKTPKARKTTKKVQKKAKKVTKVKKITPHRLTSTRSFTTTPRKAINTTPTSFASSSFAPTDNVATLNTLNSFFDQFVLNTKQFRKFSTTPEQSQQPIPPPQQPPSQTKAQQEDVAAAILQQKIAQQTSADNTQQDTTQHAKMKKLVDDVEAAEATAAPVATEQNNTDTTTDGTAVPLDNTPAYSQFKRIIANGSHKFEPTESYYDENGDECLVIYEASQATIQKTLLERKRALLNTLVSGPAVAILSGIFIPTPWSYVMYVACALVMGINAARLYGLSAFVTKITAVWPQTRSEISGKLHSNLQESLSGLTPLPGEANGPYSAFAQVEEENEFTQRQKHNAQIRKEMGLDDKKDGEEGSDDKDVKITTEKEQDEVSKEDPNAIHPDDDNLTKAKKTLEQMKKQQQNDAADPTVPVYPQPGVDPMGRVFTFNPNQPDTITWKFGWSDSTNLAQKGATPPLFERQNFAEQVRLWSQLPDPDFPEYIYIDRMNNGKNLLHQKVPMSNVASVWSIAVVPPSIPQVTPTQIEQLQGMRHDSQAILFRADNTVTGLFPQFIKHDVAFNQLIFAGTINARNECKDKFEHLRGRIKL